MLMELPKSTRITVIGDIHGQLPLFNLIIKEINPSTNNRVVFIGDVYDRGNEDSVIIGKIKSLCEAGIGYMVKGNHEARHIRKAQESKQWTDELAWVNTLPVHIAFKFSTGIKLVVLHGGVSLKHSQKNLDNSEIMYIRYIDKNGDYTSQNDIGKRLWHEAYDGRFGYIISSHGESVPKQYSHSSSINTRSYQTGFLIGQVFTEFGIKETVNVSV